MAEEAIEAIYQLERWGLPFNRTPEGKIDQRRFGGHTANHGERPVRRACYAADRTGHMILQTLYQQCVKRDVRFFNEYYCLDLLRAPDGGAAGVVAYELATGELHVFRAKSIVFATGGYGRMFRVTSNAHALTGDGPALVWRRGIPLEDMEMFQFHPTGLARLGVLLSEAARGEGGVVLNKDGERFMARYAPTIKDLAPRDMVSRAIYQEIKEGRGGRSERGLGLPRHLPPRPASDRGEAARHHRVRARLPEGGADEGAGADPTDRALRDGRHPDRHGRPRRGRPRGGGRARPLRRRRVRVRVGPRREPPWARTPCSILSCSAAAPARMRHGTRRSRRSSRSRTSRSRERWRRWTASSDAPAATTRARSARSSRTTCSTWHSWSAPRRA